MSAIGPEKSSSERGAGPAIPAWARQGEAVQAAVVLGTFEYPLMREGLAAAVAEETALELVAVDLDGPALAEVLVRRTPRLAVLDDRNGETLELAQRALDVHAGTRLVVLTHPPASTQVLQLIADGATCLSKRAPVAEIVATLVLAARSQSLVSCPQFTGGAPLARAIRSLTRREREVLSHLERGESDGQIAQALQISVATVRTHNANIFRKLAVRRRDLIRQPHLWQ